jgi:CxxC motif-containing protein (DUF1111 family)
MKKLLSLACILALGAALPGCSGGSSPFPPPPDGGSGDNGSGGGGGGSGGGGNQPDDFELGDPIDGLTPDQLAAFKRGLIMFEKRFKPSEGLGPFYNATSCASCHSTPTAGGSSQLYRNFYMAMVGTPPFQAPIDPGISPVVPAYGNFENQLGFDLEGGRPVIPDLFFGLEPVVAQRNTVPMFGVGLFEFIDNATIIANADPDDLITPDGVSGRYNTDFGALGRFGVKAQSNAIEFFTRAPLNNQMGITSDPFEGSGAIVSLCSAAVPLQVSTDPDDPITDSDPVQDPEISHDDLGDLIAYSKFLAPPPKKTFSPEAIAGELLFDQIGCTKCHIPELTSSLGPVGAYSDLLIHDMGPALADGLSFGIPQVAQGQLQSTESEWRTQPLWGVSLHAPYLHDGRAETLLEAITLHAGEAQTITDAFNALTGPEQADLITFLEHL